MSNQLIKTKKGFMFRQLNGNSTVHISITGDTRSLCGCARFKGKKEVLAYGVTKKHKLCLKCMGRRDAYEEHVEPKALPLATLLEKAHEELGQYKRAASLHNLSLMVESNGKCTFHDTSVLYKTLQSDITRAISEGIDNDQQIEELEGQKASLLAMVKSVEEDFNATTEENQKYLHRISELEKQIDHVRRSANDRVEELDAALNAMTDDRDRLLLLVERLQDSKGDLLGELECKTIYAASVKRDLRIECKNADAMKTQLMQVREDRDKAVGLCREYADATKGHGMEDLKAIMAFHHKLKEPKQHKAPELIYCLQEHGCGFKKDHYISDVTPVRCDAEEAYQMHENGPWLDRIEATDANGNPMLWLGHWNDGVEYEVVDNG